MEAKINGIQQLGVGVEDFHEAWKWYREHFSMDIRMFEEEAIAELMLAHTNGKPRARHAVLALNMQGGGGFEIWQHTGKKPEPCKFGIQLGDLGINIGKIKTNNVKAAFDKFTKSGLNLLDLVHKEGLDGEELAIVLNHILNNVDIKGMSDQHKETIGDKIKYGNEKGQ